MRSSTVGAFASSGLASKNDDIVEDLDIFGGSSIRAYDVVRNKHLPLISDLEVFLKKF
jgi:hypothetical protein